ncbi:MAG TPA: phospho-N-acetylmuramoyl-pentapeptide-transferase [Patescibacteria group bacterium]|nr:phospho-N-acetylmuramoyl-pentapeptide-transferase [Patescibacteria group bacterium]
MALFLGLLIFSFVVTSIVIVPFIGFLYRLKFTRKVEAPKNGKVPLFDKMHDWKAGTPVGGGLLIIGLVSLLYAILFPLLRYLGVYVTAVHTLRDELNIIFFSFISFGLLGFYDDFVKFFGKARKGVIGRSFGLSRYVKFFIQLTLALIIASMLYFNLRIDIIHIPLTHIVFYLGWWYIPFAALVIISFVNAYNITDGLDGLAAGLLMICLFAFWILSTAVLDTTLSVFLSLWIGALIAFLYFNIYPARIWLGDSGALSFGATLAVVGLLIGKIFALVFIGGFFVGEAASSLIQIISLRVFKRRVFKIAPFHLWLQARGWEEPKIVSRAWLAGLMLAIIGIWLAII